MADKPNKTIEAASRPAQEAVSQPAQSEQAGAGGSAGSATQAESAMRQGADQLRNQMSGMAEMSVQVSQNIITRSGRNRSPPPVMDSSYCCQRAIRLVSDFGQMLPLSHFKVMSWVFVDRSANKEIYGFI